MDFPLKNGLTIGVPESLSLFMYTQPRRAKRLFFDVIPKTVDEYFTYLGKIAECDDASHLRTQRGIFTRALLWQ